MRIITIGMNTSLVYKVGLCACIGYFDGMHLGHQKLIEKTISMAKEKGCESALITFDPDPWVTIRNQKDVHHISTFRERINQAVGLGIENIVILQFDKEMSQLSPDQFLSEILGRLNLKGMVCGFDFHYGAKGMGNAETLQKHAPFDVFVVDAVSDDKGKISSTRISECIEEGKMEEATAMMGRMFEMEGVVIHGRNKGTSMGFPTANIQYSPEYLIPKTGVYACYVQVGSEKYRAMVNVGHNPTMNYSEKISVEAHLLNCHKDLYGKHIVLYFVSYIREEIKFRSRENLIMQLEQDTRNINALLEDYESAIS